MNRMLDEGMHAVADPRHWEESFYFNWSDRAADAFGFARISYNRERGHADAVVLTMRDGKPELLYPAVRQRVSGDVAFGEPLTVRGLTLTMEEPYARWKIELRGADQVDLQWTAFTGVADVRDSPLTVPDDIEFDHYEQSGSVTGSITVRGRTYAIDGFGHRDHSWGWRDWSTITGWDWIAGQAGDRFAFNMTEIQFRGERHLVGFVHANDQTQLVERAEYEYRMDTKDASRPVGAIVVLTTVTGEQAKVILAAEAQFPLVKAGLFLQETKASFSAEFRGESFEGNGVIEHTFHVGTVGTARRAPVLARMLARTSPWRVLR
ncbi:DUF7065 domain-containing protein [Rhodococcus qingshengii]|uniref:DUF7065 domain-containing protein n=1 Tax=Rhodococcus qingshengii TaxID=334542 RepID=UPI001BE72F55|nr:hypothetical protein [Rhodococcus qingshengii]MBT2273808.1 hypothetical protein [Rhodococcus qingshengii]